MFWGHFGHLRTCGSQRSPKGLQRSPKGFPSLPKVAKVLPKISQRSPKVFQRSPKTSQRCSQGLPRSPKVRILGVGVPALLPTGASGQNPGQFPFRSLGYLELEFDMVFIDLWLVDIKTKMAGCLLEDLVLLEERVLLQERVLL